MKAILIDPEERTVSAVEHGNELRDFYSLLDCERIEFIDVEPGISVIVDGDALLRDAPPPPFLFDYMRVLIFGKGLIVGICGSDVAECTMSMSDAWLRTYWTDSGIAECAADYRGRI